MPTAPPELVIFDCDGVLAENEPVSNRVMAGAISEAGVVAFEERRATEFRKGVEAIPGVADALAVIDAAGIGSALPLELAGRKWS
jgi:hypothetical protein